MAGPDYRKHNFRGTSSQASRSLIFVALCCFAGFVLLVPGLFVVKKAKNVHRPQPAEFLDEQHGDTRGHMDAGGRLSVPREEAANLDRPIQRPVPVIPDVQPEPEPEPELRQDAGPVAAGHADQPDQPQEAPLMMAWSSSVHVAESERRRQQEAAAAEAMERRREKKNRAAMGLFLAKPLEFNDAPDLAPVAVDGITDPVTLSPMDGVLRPLGEGVVHALLRPISQRAKSLHASTLLMTPEGALLCAWFWGEEGESQVAIVMATLRPGKDRWEAPRLVSSEAGRSAQNPVLFLSNDTLVLVHTSQAAGRGQGTAEIRMLQSRDGGFTWTKPRQLFKETGAMVRNPLIPSTRNPGEWLLPLYYTPSGMGHVKDQYSVVKRSSKPMSSWPQAATIRISSPGAGLVQPALTVLPGGRILAFMRDRAARNVHLSSSDDDGATWAPPQRLVIPNNNKAVMAVTLASGAVLLMFTNSNSWSHKYPISIALTPDGGKTWPFVRDLQAHFHTSGCKNGCEFSYPAMVFSSSDCKDPAGAASPGGSLHLTYTYSRAPLLRRAAIRYMCINDPETWIRSGPPSQGVFGGS